MASYWYINEEGVKTGPFSLEALKRQGIKENTVVWREGMPEWAKAKDLYELVGFFTPLPGAPQKLTSQKKGLLILGALVTAGIVLIVMRFLTPLFASFFNTEIFPVMTWIMIGLIFVSGMVLAYVFKNYFLRVFTAVSILVFITGYFFLMREMFGRYGQYHDGFASSYYQSQLPTGNYIVDPQGRIKYEYRYDTYGINRLGIKTTKSMYNYEYQH